MTTSYAMVVAPKMPPLVSFPLRLGAIRTIEDLFPKPAWKSRSMRFQGWTGATMEMNHSNLLLWEV